MQIQVLQKIYMYNLLSVAFIKLKLVNREWEGKGAAKADVIGVNKTGLFFGNLLPILIVDIFCCYF